MSTLKKKLSNLYKVTVDKTEQLVDIGKIQLKINNELKNIEDEKNNIGHLIYTEYSNGKRFDNELDVRCDLINNSLKAIETYQQDIDKIKNNQ